MIFLYGYFVGFDLMVNFYPNARKPSAYVAGAGGGRRVVDANEACKMAVSPMPVLPFERRTKRRSSGYTKFKKRMLRSQQKCHWCSVPITMETATVDHKIPLAAGGLDNANNRVLACEPCNHRRGHRMPEMEGTNVEI